MMLAVEIILTLIVSAACGSLLPYCAYLGLLALASLARPGSTTDSKSPTPSRRFLFVIPAHDEEQSIEATVRSCANVSYPRGDFEILVIADNCRDATAAIARIAGARVVEREDQHRKSKGYAFEDVFAQLEHSDDFDRFDALVAVDADTSVDPEILSAFAARLDQGDDWIQGYYTVRNPDHSWRTRLLTYAFALVNGIWLLGQDRLGLSAGLKGNGMCFSVRGLRRNPWRATSGLVEDMEFAWRLRLAGEHVRFARAARVYGEMVAHSGDAAVTQRQRWEVGRSALFHEFAPRVAAARSLGIGKRLAYLIELSMPPLVRLVSLAIAITSFSALVAWRFPLAFWPAVSLLVISGLAIVLYLISPFLAFGVPARYLLDFMHIPRYALWKAMVSRREKPATWIRTEREVLRSASGRGLGA
jgi:cellulose synthase/poly-beta-1,6-N-acetylglucosamine synthase-like glycosyltransferase